MTERALMTEETASMLVTSVDGLFDEVQALRRDLRSRTRWLWVAVASVLGILVAGLVVLNIRQALLVDDLRRQQQAQCAAWAVVSRPGLLTPQSAQLTRDLVASAQRAAEIGHCADRP